MVRREAEMKEPMRKWMSTLQSEDDDGKAKEKEDVVMTDDDDGPAA